ncbi:MAG: thiamine diphosphokinase [Bacteroidota bacterium]
MSDRNNMTETVILCDGEAPREALFRHYIEHADRLIVTDGAITVTDEMGIQPDHLIGDFDSYHPTGKEPFAVHHDADQDTNDLEKALKLALDQGTRKIVVLGATGKRLDHTLKNLSVLKQFHPRFDELFYHDNYGITRLIKSGFTAAYPLGTQISLFPLSGTVTQVKTEGLKYALWNEDLINGEQDGSSNEVTRSPIKIWYEQGDLLLFEAHSF